MPYVEGLKCDTPKCIEAEARWGKTCPHKDAYQDGDKPPRCEGCGGKYIDGTWQHICQKCNKHVAPGELRALFVPHLCKECDDAARQADIARGNICRRCRNPRHDCYC